jgi:glycosyltransferase involved in cell wall biosynthesis
MLPALVMRPSIVTTHGLHLLRRARGIARRNTSRALLAGVICAASTTICTSHSEEETIYRSLGRWTRTRVVAIPNGVQVGASPSAVHRAKARAALGLRETDVVAAWVGTLDAVKDPLTPSRAAQALRSEGVSIVLLLAGNGPLRDELEKEIRDVEGVRVLGFRSDVARLLVAADFYVASSAREGLSFAALDAMAAGLPSAASDVPGNRDTLDGSALFAAFGDVAGFTEAFRALATDTVLRTRLGAEARARVAHHYRLDQMIQRTERTYDTALALAPNAS